MADLMMANPNFSAYLASTEIIDWANDSIKSKALQLTEGPLDEASKVKRIFEFVRDEIAHSFDVEGKNVTCKASDVLRFKEGLCYAKSHLVAALLRSLEIPAGFCYQKLILGDESPKLIVHGLNGVYLKSINRWIRLDARGNKEGVQAEFSMEDEKLAFPVREKLGEKDDFIIYSEPSPKVVGVLRSFATVEELWDNLPTEI